MSEELTVEKMGELFQMPDATEQLTSIAMPNSIDEMRGIMFTMAQLANQDLPDVDAKIHTGIRVNETTTAMVVAPNAEGPLPVLVFLHGGGWVCGESAHYTKLLLRFAERGLLVISIDYRLAPEHPFPAGFEDCVAGFKWAVDNCSNWNGDPDRVSVGGDSAGGNFSAAVATELAGTSYAPKSTMLIYGAFDFAMLDGVKPLSDENEVLQKGNRMSTEAYLGENFQERLTDPRVSPIHLADKLPPSHIVVGEADALAAQAHVLMERLESAGIKHELFVDPGMPHGYFQLEMFPATLPAIDRAVKFVIENT